jgi:Zn-dependent oligopeptidase
VPNSLAQSQKIFHPISPHIPEHSKSPVRNPSQVFTQSDIFPLAYFISGVILKFSGKITDLTLADYQGRKNGSFFAPKSPEDPDFSDYFPADYTVRSLLKSFGDLLGMSFEEILPGHKYYQAQVTSYLETQGLTARFAEELDIFFVYDTTALNPRPLGFLVLDLKERDGKAREIFCTTFAHVWNSLFAKSTTLQLTLMQTIMSHDDAQWKVQVPRIAIVSTYNRARPKKPTLLTHHEIKAFAHELGHAIHGLARGSKAKTDPRDFVEIPSIMAEFWAHDPHVLQRISCHYTYLKPEYLVGWTDSWKEKHPSKNLPPQPPQKPPLEMFSEIAFRRHPQNDLYLTLRLLWMSMFDLSIHSSSEEELRSMDIGVGCRQILDEWTGIFTPFDGKGESQNNSYLHWSILRYYNTSAYCYLL